MKNENNKIVSVDDALEKHYKQKKEIERLTLGLLVGMTITLGVTASSIRDGELNTDKSIDTFPITYYHYHTYKKDQNNVWIDNGEITVTTPMSSNDSVRYEYIDSYIKNEYNPSKNDQIVEKEENMGLR